MRVAIITGSAQGTAAHHLPHLVAAGACEIPLVILHTGTAPRNGRHYRRKLRKMLRIGFLGTLNGIRMRKWYTTDLERMTATEPIDVFCERHGIRCERVDKLNGPETIALLTSARADLAVSLGNGYISPRVFNIPKNGMINIHHEMLPDYKNAQSVIWQLHNGSGHTGYTIHRIDQQIDNGAILHQEAVPIRFAPTLGATVTATCAELLERSANGLVQVLCDFDAKLRTASPQGPGRSYTTPSFRQFLRIMRNYKRLRKVAARSGPELRV